MLKKPASGVLASLRPSTYPKGTPRVFVRCGLAWERRVSARQGWAGEKSELFEHPAGIVPSRYTHRPFLLHHPTIVLSSLLVNLVWGGTSFQNSLNIFQTD